MMRQFTMAALFALALSACGHGGGAAPPTTTAPSAFALNPSPIELTAQSPTAVVTGQDDVAGVSYTAHADSKCTGSGGSIGVAGDGIPQVDVADAPLLFIVVASGTPPDSCTLTVTGSDGTTATTVMNYSTAAQTDNVTTAAKSQAFLMTGTVTPANVTISSPTSVATVNASSFTGATKVTVTCTNPKAGVSVLPSSFTGSGTVTIAPWGQGALSGTCAVTFTDTGSQPAGIVNVTLSAPALHKLTLSPANVQFSCSGTSPKTCTTGSVNIAEVDATRFQINPRPALVGSCANSFNGPLKMANGSTYATSVPGPQATVYFYGLLTTPTIDCSRIVVGDGNGQTLRATVDPQLGTGSSTTTAATCTDNDPLAPVPGAPHGMYVWNPYKVQGGNYEQYMENYVIGKDPSFCGASLVETWASIETSKGVYNWSAVDNDVAPYLKPGLRVNLLFVDAPEVVNGNATPNWIFTQENVAQINCGSSQPIYPNWIDPTFEKDYEDFIQAAIQHYTTGAPGAASYANQVGYMRFGIGAGTEAYPGHIARPPLPAGGDPCLNALQAQGWTYDKWLQHSLNIVNFMAQHKADKQLMIALNYVATYATNTGKDPDTYTYANAAAAAAAPLGIGFGTENLGIAGVAAAGATPSACNPTLQVVNLYWCQAFYRHAGVVPLEFQPIVSPLAPGGYDVTIGHLFQYALDNNAQILEIYPQDWVYNNYPAAFPNFTGATQAQYQSAFQTTSLVLGRNPNAHP